MKKVLTHIKESIKPEGHPWRHILITKSGRKTNGSVCKGKCVHGSQLPPLKCLWLKGKALLGENWQAVF